MAKKALEGIRVIELGLYVALPITGRILASLGAEVIKVETHRALDGMVYIPAWAPGVGQPEYQGDKRRITLDLGRPGAKQVFARLLRKSDVFMTNFRRDVLARWGIDFPQVREINPDVIISWQTGMGSIGPHGAYKVYGMLMQHMSGISLMTGLPESACGVVNTSYSDYHCAVFQPLAIIGALERRRRTSKSAFIEASIFKSGVCTVGPAVLNYQANGELPGRIGNKDPYASPHGAYRCQGEDRWCVIAVFTEEQWQSFCQVIGSPSWTREPKFATLLGRIKNSDEIDRRVEEWTVHQAAGEVMERMQEAGVPAGIVAKGQDLAQSAHLKERDFFKQTTYYVPDPKKRGTEWQAGSPVVACRIPIGLSKTPCEIGDMRRIGEDNNYVYGKVLGMSREEIRRLTEEAVLI